MEINKFYIDGKFVDPDGSEKIDIVNPATEEVVGYVISGSNKDVDFAVEAANKAFPEVMALTLDQRKKILEEVLEGMEERREDFAQNYF
jgi:NAD-dependent aldehyde dehydrogenases